MASRTSRREATARVAAGVAAMGPLIATVLGDSPSGIVVSGVAVATVGITVAGEAFWLRALGQPFRQLRWVRRHASSAAEAERWMTLLAEARRDVLEARE